MWLVLMFDWKTFFYFIFNSKELYKFSVCKTLSALIWTLGQGNFVGSYWRGVGGMLVLLFFLVVLIVLMVSAVLFQFLLVYMDFSTIFQCWGR